MKPTATSRADLLRCMGQGLEPDAAAVVLGYVRVREIEPVKLPEMEADLTVTRDAAPQVEEAPVPEIEFPTERPRLTFLMPVRVESLAPPQPRTDRGKPISDAALAVDWSHQGPPLPPLTRWARLAPFLRQRLGSVIPGTALDQRRLMREVGKGLPLVLLPRRPRAAWAAQAVVLWDGTAEMYPFQRDVQDLLQRLRRERGAHGLEVRLLRRLPRRSDAARIPQGVPVIALSAMGQFQQSAAAQEAWLALARRLGFLGQEFHALNPCPRDRWQPQVAAHWPSGVWDRRPRLPRLGGLRVKQTFLSAGQTLLPVGTEGQTGMSATLSAADRLLTLLSPASRIEAPLLRTARLVLGHAADAGTEWDAWHHEQCWHSLDCFGFHPGADYEARLNQRQALTGREAVLADQIGGLMAAHHAGCSSVIAAEAELRAILSIQKETTQEVGKPQRSESEASSLRLSHLCGVKSLLQCVVDRLRLLAADPGGEEGRQSGLPGWFPGMVERLSESMRADAEVKKLIAEGLAYAHTFLETAHMEVPSGVDGEVFQKAKAEAVPELLHSFYCSLDLVGQSLWLTPGAPASGRTQFSLSGFRGSRPQILLSLSSGKRHSYRLASPPEPLRLPPISAAEDLVLESDREKVYFEARQRPTWAYRMEYRREGIWARALVDGVDHTFGWTLGGEDLWPNLDGGPLNQVGAWELYTDKPKWAEVFEIDEFGLRAVFKIQDVPFVLRWIPPGSFLMGSPEDEPGRRENEGPQHRVTISKGYWMAETPVTQAQWRAVVEAARENAPLWKRLFGKKDALEPTPSHFKGPPELPVENITWHDSTTFCRLLDALLPDGPGFHLPTEAQWEYACRAGDVDKVPFQCPISLEGDVLSPDLEAYAWYGGNSGKDGVVSNPQDSSSWLGKEHGSPSAGTHPVKTKLPNDIGLHDMLGNVWEWCADAWDEEAYSKRTDGAKDPRVDSADDGAFRVVRGGSWGFQALHCRAAVRFGGHPGRRDDSLGLRLAAGQESAEPPKTERSDLPQRRSRARRAGGSEPA